TAEQAEFLQVVLDRVDQLSRMVDSILDASRLESDAIGVQRERHDVAALVERVRPGLENRAAEAGLVFSVDVADDLPSVFCDEDSVCRIVDNLFTNACK